MKNSEKPINPIFNSDGFAMEFGENEKLDNHSVGLTKREYFAGLAIVSCSMVGMSDSEIKEYAKNAVKLADELLKQLEK